MAATDQTSDPNKALATREPYINGPSTMVEWRSVKYECVYLHAWETGTEARTGLRTWFDFYNHRRPHAALDGQPPDVVYRIGTTITQPDQETRRIA